MRHVCNRLEASEVLAKLGLKPIDRDRQAVVTHRKALREELVTIIRMLTGQPPAIKGELTLQPAEA